MLPDRAGVVVTGGGNGIGRAIAHRLVAAGARIVVNDLDGDAAARVAEEVGGLAVAGDAASADGVQALVDAARDHLGSIDVFFANAGIARGDAATATDADFETSWQVNVMAHVRAARALLPEWLERGEGRFVATASAAGLLTMLGSAPYTLSKHAAVAHAEWLSATYRHRGVVVQALCPQGVRTAMLDDSGPAGDVTLTETAITPERVAATVFDALEDDRFLILPHPEVADYVRAKAADPDRWLGGMNRLQQRVEELRADF
ncbi:SDR family oxidoreductase [Mumia sp. zg.B17]|uniref:SDR family oxidoreductase n=1 Tax=unclassified Mumia TaxID=2621872 RepID=UPI001C6E721C|nr:MULTISPECIES: SDR family oxidoreductase [unclassified Mumia]MBW9205706.1 SDR family oxidoreductase [Mumia sp. zg.B17]MBW9208293.1 SDR family oxidoreductase [Mumia sp. zg.B21]